MRLFGRTILFLLCGIMAIPVAALPPEWGLCPAVGRCGDERAGTQRSCCPSSQGDTGNSGRSQHRGERHLPDSGCSPDCLACCHARAAITAPALTAALEELRYPFAALDVTTHLPTPDVSAVFHPPRA